MHPTLKWYVLTGQVRNDRPDRVESVSPVASLYNSGGEFVGCDFTFVTGMNLSAGQTAAFEMNVTGRDFSDVASYRLQVDGTPK